MKRPVLCSAAVGLVVLFGWLAVTSATDEKKNVTFTKDVAPILFKHCAGCHQPDASAPMSLLSYKDARPWARSIKEKVLTRAMPPWGADPHFGEFANDTSLVQRDIDTLAAWVDQGAKEGDPRALPPLPAATEWALGNPDLVLAMQQEWTGAATGLDDNVEFSVPTGFTEDKWIQAAAFRPGNKRVVHHAVVLIQTPEMKAAAQTSANDSTEGLFRLQGTNRQVRDDVRVVDDGCSLPSGGGGGNNARFALTVYGPGRNADSWPTGTAKLIPAGSKLIFQMHYSKATGKPEKDRSSVALVFARKPVEKLGAPGWMKAEALPESETKFFLRAMDAQMTFVRGEKGEVTGFVFEMGNRTMQAKKVAVSGQKQ